jgi:hypothetical protein
VGAKVADTVDDANNGTSMKVRRLGVADDLATDAVLLCSER